MPDGAEHDWPVTCCSEPSLGVVKSRWFPSDLVGQKDDESEEPWGTTRNGGFL